MSPPRFYAKAVRVGDCLIWQGKSRVGPYATVGYQGTQWLAHRLSYFFATGEEPPVVRHTCDTPLCVEPTHLLAGTHADNVQDKVDRGRQPRHEAHHNARLTREQVGAIRQLAREDTSQKDLATHFGVSKQQISRIVNGKRWK